MAKNTQKIGWIGMGRMGFPMAERLLAAGYDVSIWNRTRAKAEPLAKIGGRIVGKVAELAHVDVVFSIVSTGKDLEEIYFGRDGLAADGGKLPPIFVDCSTIAVEESAKIRAKLAARGVDFVAAPVSGNGKCVAAGKLSAVTSGPSSAARAVEPIIEAFAPRGVSYVGEGDLARICKIAHNVMLGVVIENLCEITLLAEKAGVPRHAFLAFMNNSDVPMPVTSTTRDVLQTHFGAAQLKPDPKKYLAGDFAALLETLALAAGMKLTSENKNVPTGLET